MKKLFFVLFILFSFGYQSKASNKSEKFEVFRGTNVAHWLSQSRTRGAEREKFLTKKDIKEISANP